MLPDHYLMRGLDALSRCYTVPTWSWNEFMDGHRGAATAASFYLLHDRLVDADAAGPIQAMLEREWAGNQLFRPHPPAAPAPQDLPRLLAALEGAFGTSEHIGHEVIYPTFALRAFRTRPESVTAARIAGLCTMAQVYTELTPNKVITPCCDWFDRKRLWTRLRSGNFQQSKGLFLNRCRTRH